MDFLTYLAKEWSVIGQAPLTFLIAVVLAGLVAFAVARWAFSTRLENAQSTISMLEKRLDRSEQSDAIAIAATAQAPPQRYDIDAINARVPEAIAQVLDGPREFLPSSITPDSLADLFDSQTSLQAEDALQPHLGKWLTFTGYVRDVSSSNDGAFVAIPLSEGRLLFCTFMDVAGVKSLSKGDKITVIGRLYKADSLGVRLERCEIVPQA